MLTLLGAAGEWNIDWSVEWVGLIASALILISFLFTKQTLIRLINMAGCLAFVLYATLCIHSLSTALMNGALFIVHIVYLLRDYLKAKKAKAEMQQAAEETAEEPQATEQVASETEKE